MNRSETNLTKPFRTVSIQFETLHFSFERFNSVRNGSVQFRTGSEPFKSKQFKLLHQFFTLRQKINSNCDDDEQSQEFGVSEDILHFGCPIYTVTVDKGKNQNATNGKHSG